MAPPCFLCTRTSVMSFQVNERDSQRTLFVMPVWLVVTDPLASQRPTVRKTMPTAPKEKVFRNKIAPAIHPSSFSRHTAPYLWDARD